MEFRFEYPLEKSRAEVWRAFDKPENLLKWQPTLVSFEPVSGTPGQAGAVSKLTYKEEKKTIATWCHQETDAGRSLPLQDAA